MAICEKTVAQEVERKKKLELQESFLSVFRSRYSGLVEFEKLKLCSIFCNALAKFQACEKRLLIHGSILELAMRRCVLGKETFPIGVKQSTRCDGLVVQPDERLANRYQKRMLLCFSVVAQT